MPALRTVPATISVLGVLLLGACASPTTTPSSPATSTSAPGTPAKAGYPLVVENCGRTLTIPAPPERVLTGYQNTVEMMIALGLGDKVVGRQPFTQSPVLPEQQAAFDAIPELTPGLPDNAQSVAASREVQLAAQPDFVLANGEYEVNPARGVASVADFEAAGAQVFILTAGHSSGSCGKDQPTIEQVYGDLITLGRIFGVEQRAEALVAEMKADIAEVKGTLAGRQPVRVLAYDSGEGPLVTMSDRYFDVSIAGATNIVDSDQGYPEVGAEVLVAGDPEAIVTVNYEPGPLEPEAREKEAFLRTVVPQSPAVRDNRFIHMESIAFSPGVRNAQTVRDLAEALHPDAFGRG